MNKLVLFLFVLLSCAPSVSIYFFNGKRYSTTDYQSQIDQDKRNGTLFISTKPPFSDVFLDGKYIGKSNISPVYIMSGEHELVIAKGKKVWKKTVLLIEGENEPVKLEWSSINKSKETVKGKRSNKDIMQNVMKNLESLRDIYNKRKTEKQDLKGKIVVDFKVIGTGDIIY